MNEPRLFSASNGCQSSHVITLYRAPAMLLLAASIVLLLLLCGSVNAQTFTPPPFNPFVVIVPGCPGGVCGRTLPAVVRDTPPIKTRGAYHDAYGRSGLGEHHPLTHYRQIL